MWQDKDNNNNNNNDNNFYGAVIMTVVTARDHPFHLMNAETIVTCRGTWV